MNKESIISQLNTIIYPETGKSLTDEGILVNVEVNGNNVDITLAFTKPTDPFITSIKKGINNIIESKFGTDVIVNITTKVKPKEKKPTTSEYGISKVKNIIAVAGGKGGVGKSTVAANLAIALAQQGFRVGMIDADIFGPSLPKMFNLEDAQPSGFQEDGKEWLVPVEQYGVKILSVGFFVKPGSAAIWRGPMAGGVVRQFIMNADWGDLDYLLFDMPPGTGDIHLTLVQSVPVTGAVIVCTPQQVAIADARKAASLFLTKEIEVPILGVVENMSWFTPAELPNNKYYIFGKEGGQNLAKELNTKLLAQIPIVQSICDSGDKGMPIAMSKDTIEGKIFTKFAEDFVMAVDSRNIALPPTKRVITKE